MLSGYPRPPPHCFPPQNDILCLPVPVELVDVGAISEEDRHGAGAVDVDSQVKRRPALHDKVALYTPLPPT